MISLGRLKLLLFKHGRGSSFHYVKNANRIVIKVGRQLFQPFIVSNDNRNSDCRFGTAAEETRIGKLSYNYCLDSLSVAPWQQISGVDVSSVGNSMARLMLNHIALYDRLLIVEAAADVFKFKFMKVCT